MTGTAWPERMALVGFFSVLPELSFMSEEPLLLLEGSRRMYSFRPVCCGTLGRVCVAIVSQYSPTVRFPPRVRSASGMPRRREQYAALWLTLRLARRLALPGCSVLVGVRFSLADNRQMGDNLLRAVAPSEAARHLQPFLLAHDGHPSPLPAAF